MAGEYNGISTLARKVTLEDDQQLSPLWFQPRPRRSLGPFCFPVLRFQQLCTELFINRLSLRPSLGCGGKLNFLCNELLHELKLELTHLGGPTFEMQCKLECDYIVIPIELIQKWLPPCLLKNISSCPIFREGFQVCVCFWFVAICYHGSSWHHRGSLSEGSEGWMRAMKDENVMKGMVGKKII
jgi:hypothetical protein